MASAVTSVLCLCGIFWVCVRAQADECPENFTRLGQKCYFLSSEKVNWYAAQRRCGALNADLVVLDNQRELEILDTYIKKSAEKYEVWVGVNALGTSRNFVLANNGGQIPYSKWCPGEPNNHPDNREEDCVCMRDCGGYNDNNCVSLLQYVCVARESTPVDCVCVHEINRCSAVCKNTYVNN